MIVKKEAPFLIHLDEVPKAGIQRRTALDSSWLDSLLGSAYSVTGKEVLATFHAQRQGENLVMEGELEFQAAFDCSRCGEAVARRFRCPVQAVFVPTDSDHHRLDDVELQAGQEHMHVYQDKVFSVEQPFIDALAFQLEPYPRCQDGCDGIGDNARETIGKERAERGPTDPRWAALADVKKKMNGSRTE